MWPEPAYIDGGSIIFLKLAWRSSKKFIWGAVTRECVTRIGVVSTSALAPPMSEAIATAVIGRLDGMVIADWRGLLID